MTDMKNTSSAGPSAWARELHAHLTSHVEIERGMLVQYGSAAEASSSKAFKYLVDLLIEDEVRHHRVFLELADSLETQSLKPGEDPPVPYLDFNRANQEAVLDLTEQLLEKEEQDAQELKRLQHELKDVKDTSLWGLLVELMERDTQKHIAILKFVKKHAKGR
jgi:rubrerythrin